MKIVKTGTEVNEGVTLHSADMGLFDPRLTDNTLQHTKDSEDSSSNGCANSQYSLLMKSQVLCRNSFESLTHICAHTNPPPHTPHTPSL